MLVSEKIPGKFDMTSNNTADARWQMGKETYINLATYRKNGTEVRTPVWVAEQDGHYFVFSKANAGKMKRIRNGARVKVAACTMNGKLKGDWFDAKAEITTDPLMIEQLYTGFNKKYGIQMTFGTWWTKVRGTFKDRGYLILRLDER